MRALGSALASVILVCSSCASLNGSRDQHLVCPYDTVWDAALETMKDRPVIRQDKEAGVIDTDWTETAVDRRGFGAFSRELFDSKERARMSFVVKRADDMTTVSLVENRQRWHLRGGVTQQATKWWPVAPSEEAMNAVINRLNTKLKERGCPST